MRKQGPFAAVLFALFAVAIIGAVVHVSVRLRVIRTGYALGERTQERRDLEEENRRLRLEAARLRSPERIEKLAREKIGMVRPDPTRIRVARPGAGEMALGEHGLAPVETAPR